MQTESLDFYWKLAKKLIITHGYTGLLKDNENIGYVANAIINADINYNPNIGILEGYRSMHAKFAILKLIKKHKKTKKNKKLSEKYDKSYKDTSQDSIDCEDIFSYIRDNNIVNLDILEQIKDRYINNYTWTEIADKFKITKQSVRLNVKHGLSKIKKKLCI